MKTLKSIFLIFTCFGLLLSCSRDDAFEEKVDMSLKKGTTTAVFTVEPNGVDDTHNLNIAFADAINAGPGSVVQLVEGEYYIGFIEVREFEGIFKGAGKNKTIITSLTELDITPLVSQYLNTYLLKFVGGDVYMSDMTIQTPEGILTTSGEWWLEGLVSFSARNRVYVSDNDYITAAINNVDFIASQAPGLWKTNCNSGLMAGFDSRFSKLPDGWPLSPTDITITNCMFDNFDIYGVIIAYINGGEVIAGTNNNGNIFKNNSTNGYGYGSSLSFWHNVNMEASLVDNNIDVPTGGFFGIEIDSRPWLSWLQDVPQTKTSVFNIEKNKFNTKESVGAILVRDNRRFKYPDEKPMLLQVKNNQFDLGDGSFTGMGFFNTSGIVIRNNKFTGNAQYGVRVFGQAPLYNENGLLLGNNFSNASFSQTVLLLNKRTKNWTVVGGNLGELVWDFGENNIITGFNNNTSDVPLGQTIVDNLDMMRRAMHDVKGH